MSTKHKTNLNLSSTSYKLVLIFLGGFLLRLYFVFSSYHGDLNNNISWGTIAAHSALSGFYEKKDWPYSPPNQPPLTILMFAGLRLFWEAVENISWWANNKFSLFPSSFIWFWEDRGMKFLVKLPGMVADLGIAALIYKYFAKLNKRSLGLKVSALWLFNPVTWFNSSIWGQTDSIVNLLGYGGITFLLGGQLIWFAVLYTLSLLFKGSLAIFAPVLITAALAQKHIKKEWLKSIALVFAVVTVSSVWFHPKFDFPIWIINLYAKQILPGEIGSLTANAFNFWWLVDSGKTLDNVVYFGITARLWGIIASLAVIAGLCFWVSRKVTDKRVFFTLAMSALTTFLFMTRIHERYLYPFFPAATILAGLSPVTIIPYILLSAAHLLNIYHLFNAASFSPLQIVYVLPWLPNFIAFLTLGIFILFLLWIRREKSYN